MESMKIQTHDLCDPPFFGRGWPCSFVLRVMLCSSKDERNCKRLIGKFCPRSITKAEVLTCEPIEDKKCRYYEDILKTACQ